MKKILRYISIVTLIVSFTGCDLNVVPSDALTGAQITTTSDGLTSLVNGSYALLKDFPDANQANNWYLRQYYQLSDFASDDIVCGYKSEDDLTNSFRYNDRSSENQISTAFGRSHTKLFMARTFRLKWLIEKVMIHYPIN